MEKLKKAKTRSKFSALDLKAEIEYLQPILNGCKINSIYSLNNKTYLFKCGKAGIRVNFFVEAGVRVYAQQNFVEKNEKPNGFTLKLRKHLRSLFIKSIEQVGVERVVKISLSGIDENNKDFIYYLFIELYAKGNIILTDHEVKILALLRSHAYSETARCVVGEIYPLQEAAKYYIDTINIEEEASKTEFVNNKTTNGSFLMKIVPCAHQSLVETSLLKNKINPAAKFEIKQKDSLVIIAKEILAIYSESLGKTGYRYFVKGNKQSFEFSPVSLPFVR
jgi:predicted ribosome quality control (RQC) complex YloA/Tae2 family protein